MSGPEHSGDDSGQDDHPEWPDDVLEHVEHRAEIEQTKGMLVLIYGIDDEQAFDMLRKQSQQHNVQLRLLAQQIRQDLRAFFAEEGPKLRIRIDGLLLTAHLRLTHPDGGHLDDAGTPKNGADVSTGNPG